MKRPIDIAFVAALAALLALSGCARYSEPAPLPLVRTAALQPEKSAPSSVRIPQTAVLKDMWGRAYVYVLSSPAAGSVVPGSVPESTAVMRAEVRHIRIDGTTAEREILSPSLRAGEHIIVAGQQHVKKGDCVAVARLPD